MKKTLCLTSLLAIVATGAANAATDVTFAGDYQLGNGLPANVGTPLNGSTYTYTYTKSDSSTATVAQNVDPDLHFFTYTDKNGDPANLYDGGTDLTAASFDGATAADGTTVISHQTIAANETISRSNYEYVDGKGETVTLGDSARSFTETVALDSTYATVASVDVTDGSAAPVLAGTMYSYTDPDTGAVYHLNATGDGWVDANNLVVTPDAGTPQEAARDAMVAAFAADSAAIATAKTTVDGYATAEATAFAAADGVYTTDAGTISTLTTNYGTYTDATTLLGQAQTAQIARQGDFAADQALEAAAADLYNTPIETVQAATLTSAQTYADAGDAATLTSAQTYADAGDAATLTSAQTYADAGDELTLQSAKAYADKASALSLQAAKSYTDERIKKLDKDLSAGVASAVALSSVAVSNVQKGEVSVGAGYGYYNGQSAMAFGAAMGLSDRWSINTGAGLSGSDFSIRAGTNYKFKLF